MKAFIHYHENGRDTLGTAFPKGGHVTNEYKDFSNMKRYWIDKLPKGQYHVEGFYNWQNRYGKADIDIIVNIV